MTGTVFHDYNANGTRDAGGPAAAADRGVAGVSVRAYNAAGACGVAATTGATGAYSLTTTGCGAGALRIEFTGWPADLQPSFHARASSGATVATQAGSTVQFAPDGTTNLEVALTSAAQYCQNDPPIGIAAQAFGDPQAPQNASVDAVMRLAASLTGSTGTPQPAGMVGVAGFPEVGTVYGLAFNRATDRLYVGAFHKRHAGFGPAGTGAIYRIDAVSSGAPGTPAVYVDLNTVFGPATAGTDTVRGNYEGGAGGDQTWDQVGKSSLGDIELNDLGTQLYAVNMADRQLYTIPTSGALTSATIARIAIPHPCADAGDARPFGLEYRNGVLYVGGVCSAQSTNVAANLRAYVYAYDVTAGTFGATPALEFALNYPRAAGNDDAINDPTGDDMWRPWTSAQNAASVWPEPMLSDLAFDGADMVLGFRDRHGDQTGTGNVGTIRGITGGEILRACSNGAGGWNLEANGSCGGVTGAAGTATNQARGPASGGNTRGGEFYPLDHYSNTTPPFFINDTPPDYNGRHDENAQGALIQIPGFPQIASTIMDPFRFNSGGLRWYTNLDPANPAASRAFEVFQTGAVGFSKANGLGDMNALCAQAPLEVGNFVWRDSNFNGVMDPGEPPIANVVVNLYDAGGASIATATTNAAGEYYFTFAQGAADANPNDNAVTGPTATTGTYTVGIVAANFNAGGPLAGMRATVADNGGPTDGDLRDSDGVAVAVAGVTVGASVTLVGPGVSNHTIDFGFGTVDYGDLPDTGAGTGPGNYATLAADNGAVHGIVPGLFLGATVDAEADGQPNAGATGDDTNGAPDDEDGITVADLSLRVGRAATIRATATNTTGTAAQLCGFVDFNGDGDFADAGEATSAPVPNGTNAGTITLTFGAPPAGSAANTYARFRLSTDTAACSASGPSTDGEVEDYPVGIAALDFGDLPDTGAGAGPGNYATLESDNGARHTIVPGLFMGAVVDPEADGQPNAGANGDDNAGTPDDEDGVNTAALALISGTPANVPVVATNTTGAAGQICGFVDFNGDGDFADAGESASIAVPNGSNAATFMLNFGTVPAGAAASTYARFRLSTDGAACSPTGASTSGEVEDYPVAIGQMDFGDLPDPGAGTGSQNYATLAADNGPRHPIVAGLRIGAAVDGEGDGQPNLGANGDDTTGAPDDEDGVTIADLAFRAGRPANVRVAATNTTGSAAQLCGFVDYNGDGDFADAGETASIAVPTGSNNATFTLAFGAVPSNVAASGYARFRLSTDTGACSPTGLAPNGEVEDYTVAGEALDFGDLPDTGAGVGTGNYATLEADDGARHTIVPTLYMGAGVDAEADGQPSVAASADDANGSPDDEDGVNTADLALSRGVAPNVRVNATNGGTGGATVCGFIDYNGDGDFADAGESAQASLPAGAANQIVTLAFGAVPNTAASSSYARFRVQTSGTCSPTGAQPDGEVEDYPVNLGAGVLSLGNLVWNDRNNNGTVDPGEPGIPSVAVVLYRDSDDNGTPDGAPVATTSTDPNGNYAFVNLDPDTYIVEITPPFGWLGSTCSGFPYAPNGTCEPAGDPDDDVDNNDNGTGNGTTIRSGPVTLTVGGEPQNDGDGTNGNQTVDFGLLGNFDLALTKRVSAGQAGPFIAGQDVSFDIAVINQGGIAASNIVVNDYIPAGFALSPTETNWTSVSPTLATRTIAGPLAAGASTTVTIVLRLEAGAASPLVNRAEIGSADDDTDPSNTPPTDVDSTPDNDPGNDAGGSPNTPSDDATGGNGSGTPGDGDPAGDEDDADPAVITVGNGAAVLGVAKAAQVLSVSEPGGYGGGAATGRAELAYVILVRNYSTQDVTALQVTENLVAAFGAGANWSVTSVTAPTLTLNPAFDGRAATTLLAGTDTLAAGASTTIRIVLSVQFQPGTSYSNQVTGSGLVGGVPVGDASHDGTDPAPNGDPSTSGDPTVITLGSQAVPMLSGTALALMLGGLMLLALRRRRGAAF
ncbi:GEVED domain-containing protein [Tahibacter soli]|uniref:GEVED domain-containing protein n=1 Tax=Tahibacter soli TaxID=2983605 RepID=A0A9X3YS76_9GAMM|nr:GEVED domain-containing protein [Tahibacter soli]MDC8016028.1 GEVED domain-containing protein [Tahibacter soli]